MVARLTQTWLNRYPLDIVLNPVEPIARLSDEEKLKVRAEITPDLSRLFLITVGRLHEAKGYGDLLDALDELRRTHPQILLIIVGIGTFQQTITEKIHSMKLDNYVRLLGSRADVPKSFSSGRYLR